MLYPTHRRYGQAYAFIGIPIMILLGYFPKLSLSDGGGFILGEWIVVGLYFYFAYKGSLFGAEFPDIDSPGSIPARKYPFLSRLFKLFRVKHRGKFSHDFGSLTILFALIYLFLERVIGGMMEGLLERGVGHSDLTPLVVALQPDGLLMKLSLTFVIFTWFGSMSHLIADATTKQGVWFLWSIRIHFVPVFITKWGIGNFRPFRRAFLTGSSWETFNRFLMTIVLVLSIIFTIIVVV